MNAIVANITTGAVSEHDVAFQSITATHAGSVTGLYALGGDDDAGVPIAAVVKTGTKHWGETNRKIGRAVYFAMAGVGAGVMSVHTRGTTYSYDFPVRATGVSRAIAGLGIRANYAAYGYSNVGGNDFRIDRIEVSVSNSSRRL